MTEYRLTFPRQAADDNRPRPIAHEDGWVTIMAPTLDLAADVVLRIFGTDWHELLTSEYWDQCAGLDKGELLRVVHPQMNGHAVAHLIGSAHIPLAGGGQYLITVWGNGQGEQAWRPDASAVWGPPVALEPARSAL